MHIMIPTILRSFLLQCSWNLERMQNLGFLYSIMPGLKRTYPLAPDQRRAALRHLEFFNSHPYMACSIMGAIIKMEQECSEGRMNSGAVSNFKSYTMTAFAAIGDSFFWNTLKPFCVTLALIFAYQGRIWACLVFLILYNTVHLGLRVWGFLIGLEEGVGMVDRIARWELTRWTRWLKGALPVFLGVLLSRAVIFDSEEMAKFYPFVALPIALISYLLIRRNTSPVAILFGVFAGAFVAAQILGR
jgi:PTS system mannose-specific IID component